MTCDWCSKEATVVGIPNVGPVSRMCNECKDRLQATQIISMEEAVKIYPKGFYHP